MLFVTSFAFSQNDLGFILTKEQHDNIKKNLNDYRALIVDFEKLNKNFDNLKQQFELAKELNGRKNFEIEEIKLNFEKERVGYETLLANNKIAYENLKLNYDQLKEKLVERDQMLQFTSKNLTTMTNKYRIQLDYDRGDRIMEGAVFGSIVGAALLIIYMQIEDHWGRK